MTIINFIFHLVSAPTPWQISLQEPNTNYMLHITEFHMLMMFVIIFVSCVVGWLLFKVIKLYSYSPLSKELVENNPVSFNHSTPLEVAWTCLPAVILLLISIPSYALLYRLEEHTRSDLTIKIIGHQWYWSYEYSDVFLEDETDFALRKQYIQAIDEALTVIENLEESHKTPGDQTPQSFKQFKDTVLEACNLEFLETHNAIPQKHKQTLVRVLSYMKQATAYFSKNPNEAILPDVLESQKKTKYMSSSNQFKTIKNLIKEESEKTMKAYNSVSGEKTLDDYLEAISQFKNEPVSSENRIPTVNINFDSYPIPASELPAGGKRLLEVDNRLVIPVRTPVRLLITSGDVLHSWAVPSLGIKTDACPGRLNEVVLFANETGIYYGQCSELCGVNHGFMPIAVEVVNQEAFRAWACSQNS